MRIIISGPAIASDSSSQQIVDANSLVSIDGLEFNEELCATHLDGPLGEIGIQGGSLRIVFDQSSKTLRVVTEYLSPRKLKKSELVELVEFTEGQWSDGIGEGCFSPYYDKTGIAISVFPIPYDEGSVQVEQIADGSSVPRRSLLLSAAKRGGVKKLESLLRKGEDLEAKGQWGHTPLMCAVAADQVEASEFLIARGANVNYRTESGTTCIQLAAMQGNSPILSALIKAGANVNVRDDKGMTPVMWAANRGFSDAIQMLLDGGADINAQDTHEQWTALMYASPERIDIVEYLLNNGSNPMIRTGDGHTASGQALEQARRELEPMLGWGSSPERAVLYEAKARVIAAHEM